MEGFSLVMLSSKVIDGTFRLLPALTEIALIAVS